MRRVLNIAALLLLPAALCLAQVFDTSGRQKVNVETGAVTVTGTVTANAGSGTLAVTGPLTDTQIRATALPITGSVTANAGSGTFAVSGPLTDTQLRATAVPVSGTITVGTFPDNEPINLAQIAGASTAVGNGTAATSLRVTVASDSTGTIVATQSTASALNAAVVGAAAHDGTTLSNPVLGAAAAETVEDSDANTNANRVTADADLVRLLADRYGSLFVRMGPPYRWRFHSNGSAALTDTSVHASCGAGLFNYVEAIVISTGAATAFNAFFEEGATTVLGPYYLEAIAGRGLAITFPGGNKMPTAATALTVTTSAAIAQAVDVTGYCSP